MEKSVDFDRLQADDMFLVRLDGDVWLMDDHRWALYAWEQSAPQEDRPFALLHADYHWDAVNDFHGSPDEEERLRNLQLEDLFGIIRDSQRIRYDSFIAPAIIRGLLSEVHFFCKQKYGDAGLDPVLLDKYSARQTFHGTHESFFQSHIQRPKIFDLCLDLFNTSERYGEGVIWTPDQIEAFLESAKSAVVDASIVTVSLSFGYSGTVEDTRRLAREIVPLLCDWRWTRKSSRRSM